MLTPQQFFEGLQFKAFLAPSQSFNLGHAFDLGSKQAPNNYTLFATYVTQQMIMMSRCVFPSRSDPIGSVSEIEPRENRQQLN